MKNGTTKRQRPGGGLHERASTRPRPVARSSLVYPGARRAADLAAVEARGRRDALTPAWKATSAIVAALRRALHVAGGSVQSRPRPMRYTTVAVMGCVVNGCGESKHANIGISLPGTGERPVAPVYIDGEEGPTLKGERIAEEFQSLVEDYVAKHYALEGVSMSVQAARNACRAKAACSRCRAPRRRR